MSMVKRDSYLGQYLGDIALNIANVKTALGWCTLASFFGENFGDSDRQFTCLGHLGRRDK